MKLDAERWAKRRGVTRILDALGADEGLTRYVGGAVRDELLQSVNDIDFATGYAPTRSRTADKPHQAVPTDRPRTITPSPTPPAITTLRADMSTDGRQPRWIFRTGSRAGVAIHNHRALRDPLPRNFDYFVGSTI